MDVVDPIWDRAAQPRIDEVVNVDELGLALAVPLATVVLEISHQFLLFCVNRDERFVRRQKRHGLRVDVAKLRVAIDLLVAFEDDPAKARAQASDRF